MQAVIKACGRQYTVSEGELVYMEKLGMDVDETVVFDQVLAIIDGENSQFGTPTLEGAQVEAKIVRNGKSKKIHVFKYRPKKGSATRQGHRQLYTAVQIEKISF